MPRGFLVKRSQHHTAYSYRERRTSDDERGSDSGSELDGPFPPSAASAAAGTAPTTSRTTYYGSPDSGFSVSPGPTSISMPTSTASSVYGGLASMPCRDRVENSEPIALTTKHLGAVTSWQNQNSFGGAASLLSSKERHPSSSSWERENSHTITNSWTTSVGAGSFPLALTSSSASARLSSSSSSSLSPSSSSSLSSPCVRSAPCTPNKLSNGNNGGNPGGMLQQSTNGANPSNMLTNQSSPLTFTAFDTLSLCVNNNASNLNLHSNLNHNNNNNVSKVARGGSPATSERSMPLSPLIVAPNSPSRKRSGSHTDEKSSALASSTSSPSSSKKAPSSKKLRAARRINFDLDTTSPVSGTIIKEFSDGEEDCTGKVTVYGDIEPSYNLVEVTPEARAELDKIENKLGDYICQLCKEVYEDAFQLAQHRCSRIVHVEYRCPECDKVFNCPANLASHRRWHKPRGAPGNQPSSKASSSSSSSSTNRSLLPATHRPSHSLARVGAGGSINLSTGIVPTATTDPEKLLLTRQADGKQALTATNDGTHRSKGQQEETRGEGEQAPVVVDEAPFSCDVCGKKFRRQAYLKKHAQSHRANGVEKMDESGGSKSGSGSGSSGRPKPCLLCGKILLNDNERLKHEAEHKNYLINNNLLNNNNVSTATTAGCISLSSTTPTSATTNNAVNLSRFPLSATTTSSSSTTIKMNPNSISADNNNPTPPPPSSSPDNRILANSKHHLQQQLQQQQHHHHRFNSLNLPQPKPHILTTPTLSPKVQTATINNIATATATKTTSKELTCSVCSVTCPTRTTLEKHLRTHSSKGPFPCKYCESSFHSSPGLTRHINKCHPTENRQVILLQLPVSRTC